MPSDPDDPSLAPAPSAAADPVRVRRQQIARWTQLANRVGYLCFGVALVAYALTFAVGFTGAMSALIVGAVIVGTILLAPAIVLGYAVKAAERDDRERGL
jgi:ABC-type transport system involved in cytochrome bd biosynthesis fused ATPase/permease subunit